MLKYASVYLLEGIAITIAIYLITKKTIHVTEIVTLAVSIVVTSIILDIFAPSVSAGMRQGSGFGLGYMQVAGNPTPMPRQYFENPNGPENFEFIGLSNVKTCGSATIEGMEGTTVTSDAQSHTELKNMRAQFVGTDHEQLLKSKNAIKDPIAYNPLEPSFGYKEHLPDNWDNLDQVHYKSKSGKKN